MRRGVLVASLLVCASALTACGGETKVSAPDPTPGQIQLDPPHQVIGLPEGFRNVAEVCDDGGNMLVVTSRGYDWEQPVSSGVAVILNDQRCKR